MLLPLKAMCGISLLSLVLERRQDGGLTALNRKLLDCGFYPSLLTNTGNVMDHNNCIKCDKPMKDKGTYYRCSDCGIQKENISGIFKYASGYNMTPSELRKHLKEVIKSEN